MLLKAKAIENLLDGYNQLEKGDLDNELNITKEGLELIVYYDDLINLLNSTKILEGYLYTLDSWGNLINCVSKAESMVEAKESTIEEVNNAVEGIERAVGNLEEIEEKIELKELLTYADTIRDISFVGVTTKVETKWSNFQIYREVARESLLSPERTQEETNVDIWCLNYYIEKLMN